MRQVLIDTESSPLLPFTFKMQKSFPKPGFPQTSETRPHLTCIHTRQKRLQLLPVDGTLAVTPSIVPMFPRHLSTAQTKWPMPFAVESKLLFSWPEGSIFFFFHSCCSQSCAPELTDWLVFHRQSLTEPVLYVIINSSKISRKPRLGGQESGEETLSLFLPWQIIPFCQGTH